MRNFLNSELRKARKNYYANCLTQAKNDSKKLWQILNEILCHKNRGSSTIASIQTSQAIITHSKEEIANEFNLYFSSIGQKLSQAIEIPLNCNFKNFLTGHFPDLMYLTPVTEEEVFNIYRHCNISQATDIDGFKSKIFVKIFDLILSTVTELFNLSFETDIFPKDISPFSSLSLMLFIFCLMCLSLSASSISCPWSPGV